MKKIIFCIIGLILLTALVACNPTPEAKEYTFNVPPLSEHIGYELDFSAGGNVSDKVNGIYKTLNSNIVSCYITAKEGYTFEDLIVKDNGKKVTLTDVTVDEYSPTSMHFEIANFNEDHTITIEGVKKIQLNLTLNRAKYVTSDEDKKGEVYEDYDSSNLIIWTELKGEDPKGYDGEHSIKNAVQNGSFTLDYGTVFILKIEGKSAPISALVNYLLYIAKPEFNGFFAKITDGENDGNYEIDYALAEQVGEGTDGFTYNEESNTFTLNLTLKEDTHIYFNTFALPEK